MNSTALKGASRTQGACKKTGRVTSSPLALASHPSPSQGAWEAGASCDASWMGRAPTTTDVKKVDKP